ncbi:hypothetical protein Q5530_03355 [Saccharothrix sp. BKS2]|uniref:hypothetical protein n=1 Tax=Saccharothrix sp. BKS2 TaxID=3064400 RepID=UPI0039EA7162
MPKFVELVPNGEVRRGDNRMDLGSCLVEGPEGVAYVEYQQSSGDDSFGAEKIPVGRQQLYWSHTAVTADFPAGEQQCGYAWTHAPLPDVELLPAEHVIRVLATVGDLDAACMAAEGLAEQVMAALDG